MTFKVKSDSDIVMFEAIKDEHEADQFESDRVVKGISTTDRLGFAATDERMQMLVSFLLQYHVSAIFSQTSISIQVQPDFSD